MKELIENIIGLMGDIGAIEKDGKNDFHKYKYLSHAGIMKKLQPQLVKRGLLIYPSNMEVVHSDGARVITKQEYTVTDGTDSIKIYGIGEGVDKGDKASYKAQTGGHKYALKALLTLPDENDAEGDSSTDKDEAKGDFPKSGQVSAQKAGKKRGAHLQSLEHLMGIMKEKVFDKYGIVEWAELDKATAEKMLDKYDPDRGES